MRTTLNLDDAFIARAQRLTGIQERTAKARLSFTHFVIGELACGKMRNRAEVMSLLSDLPSCTEATNDEVLQLIQRRQLMGRGIGFVDAPAGSGNALSRYDTVDAGPASGTNCDGAGRRLSNVAMHMAGLSSPHSR